MHSLQAFCWVQHFVALENSPFAVDEKQLHHLVVLLLFVKQGCVGRLLRTTDAGAAAIRDGQ
jgi:hypothetical protein